MPRLVYSWMSLFKWSWATVSSWLLFPAWFTKNTVKLLPDKAVPYEDKYKDKYLKLLKNPPITESTDDSTIVPNRFVIEQTPMGGIIMRYNKDTNTFEYYCDRLSVVYTHLEVVGRKYVTTFMCPQIFVNMDDEVDQCAKRHEIIKEAQIEKDKKLKQSSNIPKKSVFARLKNTPLAKIIETPPTKLKINQYTRIGRISEFSPLISTPTVSPAQSNTHASTSEVELTNEMSYADYLSHLAKIV